MTDPTPEDRTLAGELALRVLNPADEARARDREASDPAFARDVDRWNEDLAVLADEIAPVQPSPGVWPAIAARLWGAANDNARVTFWRRWAVGATGLLAASLAAVAVLVARPAPAPVVVETPAPAPSGVTRVATLQLETGSTAVTLAYDTATGALFVAPTQSMPLDAVPHLWLVLPNEGGVRLVGAIDPTNPATHSLPAELSSIAGAAPAVAISMEAPGHTPAADTPDGPVIAQGEMVRL